METIITDAHERSSLLNQIWRMVATGLCFMLFGIGGLFMSTFWFPLLHLVVKDRQRCTRLTQNSIRFSFQCLLRLMRLLGCMDYQFYGIDKLQQDSGCIVVANHPSLLDYVFLASVMPRCDCIVKQKLLSNPFVRGVILAAGYIANSEPDALLSECKNKLDQQGIILIFPEGTRSTLGEEMHLQRGAANIALRCRVNIRIVNIQCDQPMLTKQRKWYNLLPKKPLFQIVVKERIGVNDYIADGDASPAIAARHLTQLLNKKLQPEPAQTNEKK
ncbi:lysophospholipid acyltransferase family protein [Budvicia diplopodorum]|uniref:lysophospholipid acyltransferase family protein n=1 Tax=Budvicia diplopodorum TaxID=1119056 RepID=UPI0013580491|nr:lysophospholipid acyltransferase family protein [Budvicia diplopodorum]